MKFNTRSEALRYKMRHTFKFQKRLRVVKSRYWSMALWKFVPCWTVILGH